MKKRYIEPGLYTQTIVEELPIAMSKNDESAGTIDDPSEFHARRHQFNYEEDDFYFEEVADVVEEPNGWKDGLW